MASAYFKGSDHAAAYFKFRPTPPTSLINKFLDYLKLKLPPASNGKWSKAIDVGCGSGQSTEVLADSFDSVIGCDASEAQVKEANLHCQLKNVRYEVSTAETLPFPSASVQLVTACAAAHWFDMKKFYSEVNRIIVKGGVVALYCYSIPHIANHAKAEQLSNIIADVKLAGCFGEGRKNAETKYRDPSFTPPFPDHERSEGHFKQRELSVKDIEGYLSSLSGYRQFCQKNGQESGILLLEQFTKDMMGELGVGSPPEDTLLEVQYSYFVVMGRKPVE